MSDCKFKPGKTYKTRDGRDAIVYAVYPNDRIHGAYKPASLDRWLLCSWGIDGRVTGATKEHCCDLMHPSREWWISHRGNDVVDVSPREPEMEDPNVEVIHVREVIE